MSYKLNKYIKKAKYNPKPIYFKKIAYYLTNKNQCGGSFVDSLTKIVKNTYSNSTNDYIIYITGFGPFGEILINPSEGIANYIEKTHNYKTNIIDVNKLAVDNYFSTIKKQDRAILFLHFGVHPFISNIHVEKYSYNVYQMGEVIDSRYDLGSKVETDYDLSPLETEFMITNTIGDFICNYIYYKSLLLTKSFNDGSTSLFFHIPNKNISELKPDIGKLMTIIRR